ncbi:hypothetical protein D5085_18730 [Ectothiorhodospiraceae bacterium BW-2]|nr:hypothetical protein D5085_18730 [Ectothiorhodospiraceae bacterium BW-2]
MANYDIFNGDADGICALIQRRLADPKPDATLITGVKRDIALLKKIAAKTTRGDQITVLDIAVEKNLAPLEQALANGATVWYADHHRPGPLPDHSGLTAHIDTAATTCTSLIVDQTLQGRYRPWAVVAAFGDGLLDSAMEAAKPLQLTPLQRQQLRQLGELLNYNGYGAELDDLHCHPAALYQQLVQFEHPLDFLAANSDTWQRLQQGYEADMAATAALSATHCDAATALYILPDEPWARRVSGVFANQLMQHHPDRAHAILTDRGDHYVVSVRAPYRQREGAVDLCRQFETGGGRAGAAGINHLPQSELQRFTTLFQRQYPLS